MPDMEITLKRVDDAFRMEATNEDGHIIVMDGAESIGGSRSAMRPMQALLASLAGCSTIDVVHILRRQRQPLDGIEVSVEADREKDKVPALFTRIHLHYRLSGNLKPEKVERAICLSMEKYCSVAKILEKTAPITWSYEIEEATS